MAPIAESSAASWVMQREFDGVHVEAGVIETIPPRARLGLRQTPRFAQGRPESRHSASGYLRRRHEAFRRVAMLTVPAELNGGADDARQRLFPVTFSLRPSKSISAPAAGGSRSDSSDAILQPVPSSELLAHPAREAIDNRPRSTALKCACGEDPWQACGNGIEDAAMLTKR